MPRTTARIGRHPLHPMLVLFPIGFWISALLCEHERMVTLAADRIGNRLGPWRIDRVIESGGMGTVYEASRADGQYEKQVALKCMRAEMSTPVLIDAFMRERNHLAQLDHPHIAPLLDGGVEGDGRVVESRGCRLWRACGAGVRSGGRIACRPRRGWRCRGWLRW